MTKILEEFVETGCWYFGGQGILRVTSCELVLRDLRVASWNLHASWNLRVASWFCEVCELDQLTTRTLSTPIFWRPVHKIMNHKLCKIRIYKTMEMSFYLSDRAHNHYCVITFKVLKQKDLVVKLGAEEYMMTWHRNQDICEPRFVCTWWPFTPKLYSGNGFCWSSDCWMKKLLLCFRLNLSCRSHIEPRWSPGLLRW